LVILLLIVFIVVVVVVLVVVVVVVRVAVGSNRSFGGDWNVGGICTGSCTGLGGGGFGSGSIGGGGVDSGSIGGGDRSVGGSSKIVVVVF